jgi:uncharacterized protein HemY
MHVYALDGQATADLLLLLVGRRSVDEEGAAVDLRAETRRLSEECLALLNSAPGLLPCLLATRGALCFEEGDFDEAGELLAAVKDELDHASHVSFCACYLALAAAGRGDADEADRWLDTARKADPWGPLAEDAARRVADLDAVPRLALAPTA